MASFPLVSATGMLGSGFRAESLDKAISLGARPGRRQRASCSAFDPMAGQHPFRPSAAEHAVLLHPGSARTSPSTMPYKYAAARPCLLSHQHRVYPSDFALFGERLREASGARPLHPALTGI
jgi:hypothetical protein